MAKRAFISAQGTDDTTFSLRVRAAVVCAILALGIGLIAARATQFYLTSVLTRTYKQTGEGAARHLARALPSPFDERQFRNKVAMLAESHPAIERWTLRRPDGAEMTWPSTSAGRETTDPEHASVSENAFVSSGLSLFAPALPESISVRVLHATAFGELVLQIRTPPFQRFSSYWFIGLFVCVTAAGVVGFLAADPYARTTHALQSAFKRLGKGDYGFRLRPRGGREVRLMIRQLNVMASRLSKMQKIQERRNRQLEFLNQTKSEFLSIVSHDLRTPLTSVKFYTELMLDGSETLPDAHRAEFLQIMNAEADRLSRLIDDLLDLQRLDSGRMKWSMQEADLSDTIRETVRSYEGAAAAREITIHLDCPETLPLTVVDADRMVQVVGNLISNAIKFSPTGGDVWITVKSSSRELRLDVKDSGAGLPREQWSTIFEKFVQLEDPNVRESSTGSGLGLYIVKKILDAHNGSVWVDSEPGEGACFSVTLPAGKALVAEPLGSVDESEARAHVLICDSDPFIAARIAQIAQTAGYAVSQAHTGQQLLSLAQRKTPSLIITEITLPDLDGLELIRLLKLDRETESIPIVAHTYAAEPGQVLAAGAVAHLAKPATRDQIEQYVQAYQRKDDVPRRRMTVLVADAKLDVRKRASRVVVASDHVAIEAESFEDMVHKAKSVHPDLLMCGESLVGNDDWNSLTRFKQSPDIVHLPVIVLVEKVFRRHARLAGKLQAVYVCQGDLSESELKDVLTDIEERKETENPEVEIEELEDG
jgi:signal transduction histidine kinase/CheY-like chemotaxis protein